MRTRDVFTPGGYPTLTLIQGHLKEQEAQLRRALDMGNIAVSISGPSKSGKTTFVQSIVGEANLILVNGAGVACADDAWTQVLHKLGLPVEVTKSTSTVKSTKVEAKVSGEGGLPFLAKAGAEALLGGEQATDQGSDSKQATSLLQSVIANTANTDFVILIDDFHYIPEPIQQELAKQIKEAVGQGANIICASVPYHSDDILRANPDLRGRIMAIDLNYWSRDVLSQIAETGFPLLNLQPQPEMVQRFAEEAAGSPQLMQSLCLNACYALDIRQGLSTLEQLPAGGDIVERACTMTVGMNDYSSTFNAMKQGPKVRGKDRKSYLLKGDTVSDVYPIVLQAIALDPPTLTLRYPDLIARVDSLCERDKPTGSSLTGTCSHIAQIANDTAGRFVAEWDSGNDVLDIQDPYLLFYLRWGANWD